MKKPEERIVAPAETSIVEGAENYSSFRYAVGAILAFFGISTKTHRASKKRAKLVGDVFTYIILLFGSFLMVYPFWWMVAGSFSYTIGGGTTTMLENLVWWPSQSTIGREDVGMFFNYRVLFTSAFASAGLKVSYWRAVLNNLIYSIVPVVVGVITSASAAFSFAKIPWIGRNIVFFFLLAAIMVPGPSLMITQYVMYSNMGWAGDSPLALIIPGMFGSIMTAFFIRQFLFGLPTSIIEAAKIDGAGYFRIFVQFILPLAMPAIMAQGLLSFMGCWNNYMGSFIYVTPTSKWINLPHAMQYITDGESASMGTIVAASVMCVLPVIILFGCFQKLIIGSLMLTGSKE